jgi:hypothetical protein
MYPQYSIKLRLNYAHNYTNSINCSPENEKMGDELNLTSVYAPLHKYVKDDPFQDIVTQF